MLTLEPRSVQAGSSFPWNMRPCHNPDQMQNVCNRLMSSSSMLRLWTNILGWWKSSPKIMFSNSSTLESPFRASFPLVKCTSYLHPHSPIFVQVQARLFLPGWTISKNDEAFVPAVVLSDSNDEQILTPLYFMTYQLSCISLIKNRLEMFKLWMDILSSANKRLTVSIRA